MELILEAASDPLPLNEFQGVTSVISEHLSGSALKMLQENDEKDDITYLAGKTGTDARLVAMTSLAHDFGEKNDLPPETYYALFRSGLPTTEAGLSKISAATFSGVMQKAIDKNIISAVHAPKIAEYATSFENTGISFALNNKGAAGASSMGEFLNLSLQTDADKNTFAKLYRDHQETPEQLWQKVTATFGQAKSTQLQLDGKLGLMTINNGALVSKLRSTNQVQTDPIELVQKGFYKPERWNEVLTPDIPLPTFIEGTDNTIKTQKYATLMAAQLRVSYPTAILSQQISSSEITFTNDTQIKNGVSGFLNTNQGKFEIGKTPVSRYIKDNNIQLHADPSAHINILSGLKRLERVYQLSPSDKTMSVLLDNQLDSAFTITNNFSEQTFVQKFSTAMGSQEEARFTYAKSSMVASAVMNIVMAYGTYRRNPSVYAINAGNPLHQDVPGAGDIIANPTLEELFGEMDYCECKHCRSVLSPAAYLVDLLKFIDKKENLAGKQNPYDILIRRRPDLEYIALTCENTNTVLPYIDLVNEILEHFVVNGNLTAFKGYNVGENEQTEDLLANPQFVNDQAYQILSEQVYPLALPFNYSLETLRAYLDQLKAPLWKAIKLLRANDSTGSWKEIYSEYLGLSPQQYDILTNNTHDLNVYYGEAPGELLNEILAADNEYAKKLTRKLNITYKELVQLVKTRFINPNAYLVDKLEKLQVPMPLLIDFINSNGVSDLTLPDDIDLSKYDGNVKAWLLKKDPARGIDHPAAIKTLILITDPTGDTDECNFVPLQLRYADLTFLKPVEYWKLLRFVRLWKTLGWSIGQTDTALSALYPKTQLPLPADPDNNALSKLNQGFVTFIVSLAQVLEVMDRLRLNVSKDLEKALSFWSDINTYGTQSLYRQLFLSQAIRKLDSIFEDDGYGQYLQDANRLLSDHTPALVAALNITDDSLQLLRSTLTLPDRLTLTNISLLYRYASLSRALRISIEELLIIRRLSGIDDPFGVPGTVPANTIRFIETVEAVKAAGFKIPNLDYLLTHEDLSGNASPSERDILSFASNVRATLLAIERENTEGIEDPSGELARAKLAQAYGTTAADRFFGIIDGTTVTAAAYTHHTDTLEASILAITNQLSYDSFAKQLSFQGAMSAQDQTAYKALGILSPFNNVIDLLFVQSRSLFDQLPALGELYQSKFEALDLADRKAAYGQILPWLFPIIKPELKRLAVRELLGTALSVEPRQLITLAETPAVLHGVKETDPLITDFNAIAQGPGFTEDTPVAGQQRFRTYLEAPVTSFFNFYINTTAATINVMLDGHNITGTLSNNLWTNNAAISLKAGELSALEIVLTGAATLPVIRWATSNRAKEIIPPGYLYSYAQVGIFRDAYLRLLKSITLLEKLSFSPEETAHFSRYTKVVAGDPVLSNWLNAILCTPQSIASGIPEVFAHFQYLLGYVSLREALKISSSDLITILKNPGSVNEKGEELLLKLTGWSAANRNALLQRLGWNITNLSNVTHFSRLADALALLSPTGLPASLLLSTITTTPTAQTLRDLQAALRVRYDTSSWREVIRPINDRVRTSQRDALVVYVLDHLRKDYNTSHINTSEKLFEYFLIDVEMDACMQTSRIKQAISSVQLFIHRCLINLEKEASSGVINTQQWDWMRRYRVWEANRKVFLWPENWLEPELRDNKSSFFRDLESELLQADITEESAANALLHYLEKLDTVSKLQISGMYIQENEDVMSKEDDIIHVFGRTTDGTNQYYYRRQEFNYWTAWEKVELSIEDNPLLPVIWQGRLFLFWLNLLPKGRDKNNPIIKKGENSDRLTEMSIDGVIPASEIITTANICWSEYFNGRWQPKKTSDINQPLHIANSSIGRNTIFLEPYEQPDGSLIVEVKVKGEGASDQSQEQLAFFNKQSTPQKGAAAPRKEGGKTRDFLNDIQMDELSVRYFDLDEFRHDILLQTGGFTVFSQQEPHQKNNRWESPFFFQNNMHAFYVEPEESIYKMSKFTGYGWFNPGNIKMAQKEKDIPPIWQQPVVRIPSLKDVLDPLINPALVKIDVINPQVIAQTDRFNNASVKTAMVKSQPTVFNGVSIGSIGRVDRGIATIQVRFTV
jgi:hypothetical protein